MGKVAVLCPIHRNPDLILEQLENYSQHSMGNLFHILHVSKEGKSNFHSDFIDKVTSQYGVICSNSRSTSWKTVMGAFLECSNFIEYGLFDYVYIHTDGDLLVKGNLEEYIYKNKIAYSGDFPQASWNWPHYEQMINDVRFKLLRKNLGIKDDELLVGRQEGAFFPIELWLSIVKAISEYFQDDFFDDLSNHWPLEEVLIPTLARFFTGNSHRTRNVIRTKELKFFSGVGNPRDKSVHCVDVTDVAEIVADNTIICAGAKWFSQDSNDEARLFVKNRG